MSTRGPPRAWDLGPVLELVNALSVSEPSNTTNDRDVHSASRHIEHSQQDRLQAKHKHVSTGLGDFTQVWQYLGVPTSVVPVYKTSTNEIKPLIGDFSHKHDYASDGAVRYGLRGRERKTVTWRDDTSIDDVAPGSSPEREAVSDGGEKKLTKSQRKKKNRRERKAKEAANNVWTVSESEADNVFLQTPARKASLHGTSLETVDRRSISRQGSGHHANTASNAENVRHSVRQASQPELPSMKPDAVSEAEQTANTTQWPIVPKPKPHFTGFFPASVSPKPAGKIPVQSKAGMFPEETLEAVRAVQAAQAQLQTGPPSRVLPNRAPMIEPKIVRSGEDRHWALLLKLINEFQQDRKYLVAPMNMTTHNNDPSGLHLFVDASNIFIGFNEQLKRSRNIPTTLRVPSVDLSFDALALLMERRRPIAKRTLVGSTPRLAAFDKAEAVGYECNILEKVYKARELTERQIYFKERDTPRKTRSTRDSHAEDAGYSSGGGYTSEPGTAGKQYAPARMIEQGVDELLHMKMAQSLLDYDTPATMVVATGDAAQAEYSDGFKAMIERALRKGWTVELVSWSKNISSLYLRKDFQAKWQDRFKVIYLDDYAEELLDM